MVKNKKVGVKQVLLGSILLNNKVLNALPVILFLTFVGLFMITNRFKAEKIIRETVLVQDSIKVLKLQSVTIEAELVGLSRFSKILEECEKNGLDLNKSDVPPVTLKAIK